ncbi:hypothetical protein GCM10012319_70080 [Comamonas sp. KCTC 72670]|nr:hypothetical protein GCM10012319_70080 [Comamonas sp. KCTC 72670]
MRLIHTADVFTPARASGSVPRRDGAATSRNDYPAGTRKTSSDGGKAKSGPV